MAAITAPSIRKQLLAMFEELLIPSLTPPFGPPQLILAQPPFSFPSGLNLWQLPIPPLPERTRTGEILQNWPQAEVNAVKWPHLFYLCEGEADFRIGVTSRHAEVLKAARQPGHSGCWVVTLKAPALIIYPPGVPYPGSSRKLWERAGPPDISAKVVSVDLTAACTLCHSSMRRADAYEVNHSLMVKDPLLNDALKLVTDELQGRAMDWEKIAHSLFHAFIMRLHRRLVLDQPALASTAWASPMLQDSFEGSARDVGLLSELHEFIHVHLRDPLSLTQLAAQARLSPSQLNRVFMQNLGRTPMQYVTQLRMEAAGQMFRDSPFLPVREVMSLVGYEDPAHFSRLFSAAHGTPPRAFRNQCQQDIASLAQE